MDKTFVRSHRSPAYALPRSLRSPDSSVASSIARAPVSDGSSRTSRLSPSVGVVVFVTLATTLGIVALGAAFDATIDREVTVDNPDYPPESTCETFGEDGDSVFVEQCDRPERIDVDVGEELRSASGEYVGYALIGVPIWWAIFALALHGGARLAGDPALSATRSPSRRGRSPRRWLGWSPGSARSGTCSRRRRSRGPRWSRSRPRSSRPSRRCRGRFWWPPRS